MFVSQNTREKRIGTKILKELEIWVKELGYKKCFLETGRMLHEAIGLYKRNNYIQIANFGPYEGEEKVSVFQEAFIKNKSYWSLSDQILGSKKQKSNRIYLLR